MYITCEGHNWRIPGPMVLGLFDADAILIPILPFKSSTPRYPCRFESSTLLVHHRARFHGPPRHSYTSQG